jgi:hypothetical protein
LRIILSRAYVLRFQSVAAIHRRVFHATYAILSGRTSTDAFPLLHKFNLQNSFK